VAQTFNLMVEAARIAGDVRDAYTHYRRAIQTFEHIDAWQAVLPTANLGLLQLTHAEFSAARRTLQAALNTLQQRQLQSWAARIQVCMRPCAIVDENEEEIERHLQQAETLIARGTSAREWQEVLRQSATLLHAQGQSARALRVEALLSD